MSYDDAKTTKRLVLLVSLGRSGTRWLTDIFDRHDNVAAFDTCDRHPFEIAFHRWARWNELPVDLSGVLELVKTSITDAWRSADTCMVSTLFFGELDALCRELRPDELIWAVNEPVRTVTSFYNKGWFDNEIVASNPELACGPQPAHRHAHHHFTRLVPRGPKHARWRELDRFAKIAWLWSAVNTRYYSELKAIRRRTRTLVYKLDDADQNHDYYLELAHLYELAPLLSRNDFLAIKAESVKPTDNTPKAITASEREDFERETAPFRAIYDRLPGIRDIDEDWP